MAVKMLTTKKHSKTAKLIQKSKEPINEGKTPMKKIVKTISNKDYINALMVVKQYENENPKDVPRLVLRPNRKAINKDKLISKAIAKVKANNGILTHINLYKEISVRVANRLCVYFREKGIELDMANFDVAYLKHINLSEINQMRNFGKGSLYLLKEYLEKQK
jgi:hypothetical protein